MLKFKKLSNRLVIFIYLLFALLGYFINDSFYHSIAFIGAIELFNQLRKNQFISAYSFWTIGFLFLIATDGIISNDEIIAKVGSSIHLKTSSLFLFSQLIIIYYHKKFTKKQITNNLGYYEINIKQKLKPIFIFAVLSLYIIFLISELPNAYESLLNSRFDILLNSDFGGINEKNKSIILTLFSFLSSFSGYMLPSLIYIVLYKRTSNLIALGLSFLLSSIIWAIYIIIGTRHNIIFSFLGLIGSYSLLNINKIKFKFSYIILIIFGYLLSSVIVEARRDGLLNYITGDHIEKYKRKTEKPLTDKTAVYMSYVVDYYDKNEKRLGKSSAALLFFWVPRKFWNDKPPQFGFWFIREYLGGQKGFSDKFSAPSSYLGVPYSDFGFIGVFIISFLIGFLTSKVDHYFNKNKQIVNYKTVLIFSFCLASFFFLPRQLNQFFSKFIVVIIFLNIIFYFNKYYFLTKNQNDKKT